MELFRSEKTSPLAWRMQPRTLEEFIGQSHILGSGKPLREAIEKDSIVSLIFYGPPGTGKTALARIIARKTRAAFISLNAVTSGIHDIKDALKEAQKGLCTILFIDEIHRFNKLQQDALLPDVEAGNITLIGASTQNPFFAIIPALSSRSMIFQFLPLQEAEIKLLIERTLKDSERGLGGYEIHLTQDAMEFIAKISEGDARRALNAIEFGSLVMKSTGRTSYDIELAKEVLQKKSLYYNEDEHYNTISAFIKSMRGGDPDAVLYWMAKMLEAGEDPIYIARRIVIQVAVAAMNACELLGMPEARIPLSQAAIYITTAPKSNSSFLGLEKATAEIKAERTEQVPVHLREAGYPGASRLGAGVGYKYPHDYKGHFVDQEYFPGKKTFFHPSDKGYEKILKKRLQKRRII
jgi:putative ATPase